MDLQGAERDRERLKALEALYGVPWPAELLDVWSLVCALDPDDPRQALRQTLGVSLCGPFDVLAGDFEGVTLRYPALLHWRYSHDPPEFFTVMTGQGDGLHWGYWFDEPGQRPPCVVSYYARDAYELRCCGQTLFEALVEALERAWAEAQEDLRRPQDASHQAWSIEQLARCDALRPKLLQAAGMAATPRGYAYEPSAPARGPVWPTLEGMGVACPAAARRPLRMPSESASAYDSWEFLRQAKLQPWIKRAHAAADAGYPGTALWLGRQLWGFDAWAQPAAELLERGYMGLGRPILARVVREHARQRWLPNLNLLHDKAGQAHAWHEVEQAPEQIESLSLRHVRCSSQQLASLASLPRLRRLSLIEVKLGPWPRGFALPDSLREILVWGCGLTRSPTPLLQAKRLESLCVCADALTTLPVRALARHPTLQALELRQQRELDAEQVQALRRARPSLRIVT